MKIAILIPCLNEEQTIATVVRQFRQQLPDATVYIFDNASTDATALVAARAGAVVVREDRRGKGFVVQSMFRDIDADVYVMVDGDDTYPADIVHDLIRPVVEGRADMTVGSRMLTQSSEFRRFNRTGNQFFATVINTIFGTNLTDILSGYRAFNRRFVKELPIFVTGFEVETELTIKALERGFVVREVPSQLAARPEGSHSKLRRFRDGGRILWTIVALVRDYRPLTVFSLLGMVLTGCGLLAALPLIRASLAGDPVSAPATMVSTGFILSGVLVGLSGLIVHTINRRLQEAEYVNRQVHKESMTRPARPMLDRRAA